MPTLIDFLLYLGYDETDDNITRNANSALESAKSYVKRAVGDDVFELLPNDPTVVELVKIFGKDFYDERGSTSAKAGNAQRAMVQSMMLQLRLELSRKREEATA